MLAGSYTNCPLTYHYGVLHVTGGGSYRAQELIDNYGNLFYRFRSEQGKWTDWRSPNKTYQAIPDGSDITLCKIPGVYQLAGTYQYAPCHYGMMFIMSGPNYTMQLIVDTDGSIHTRNATDENNEGLEKSGRNQTRIHKSLKDN